MRRSLPNKRIPIRNKGSNEFRYSAATPGYTAAHPSDPQIRAVGQGIEGHDAATPDRQAVAPLVAPSDSGHLLINASVVPEPSVSVGQRLDPLVREAEGLVPTDAQSSAAAEREAPVEAKATKSRPPPMTMEAFITQAYARKGQRVVMNFRLEKSLSTHHRLDQDASDRLWKLAQQDHLLTVPRQILLAAMSVESHAQPKRVLIDFVHATMHRHPIFSLALCKQALEQAAAVPNIYSLLKSIQTYTPVAREGIDGFSASDLEVLRLNALKLMLVWLFHSKGIRLEEITSSLLHIVWKPASSELNSDVQRLRVLTDISEPAAIGWVAEQYLKTATEAQDSEERVRREAVILRSDLTDSRCELAISTSIVEGLRKELERAKQDSDQKVKALQEDKQLTRTHLSHDIELMRGRMVESLRLNIERLQTGLAALNREVPRVGVMVERAEMVVESLKVELKELEGEA